GGSAADGRIRTGDRPSDPAPAQGRVQPTHHRSRRTFVRRRERLLMVMTRIVPVLVWLSFSPMVQAAEAVKPVMVHLPVPEAEADKVLALDASIEAGWAVEKPEVRYRTRGAADWKSAPLLRSSAG